MRLPNSMTIAGEFYLLAHDDRTGRPRLHQRAVALGLAAALLAELLYLDRVRIIGTEVVVLPGPPPTDPLIHSMYDMLLAEQHPLRTWLVFFATTSTQDVVGRLERARILAPRVSRRWFRPVVTWLPTNPTVAAMSYARLSTMLRRRDRLIPIDVVLAGLTVATELDTILLQDAHRETHDYLQAIVADIWPPLRDLLAGTSAVIGGEVLSHRM
jgi:hypothetical protein